MNQCAVYAIAEWTPVDWFSIGTGFGVDGLAMLVFDANGSWSGYSIPLSLGFNIGRRPADRTMRSVFRIGVEGAVGFASDNGGAGWHASVTFGYAVL
jgi:hypothetical protein